VKKVRIDFSLAKEKKSFCKHSSLDFTALKRPEPQTASTPLKRENSANQPCIINTANSSNCFRNRALWQQQNPYAIEQKRSKN
jgi:hypothetical protein